MNMATPQARSLSAWPIPETNGAINPGSEGISQPPGSSVTASQAGTLRRMDGAQEASHMFSCLAGSSSPVG